MIRAIRWFKRNVSRNEKGSRLVVCKECYPAYKKRRDKYISRQILYLILGMLFAIVGLVARLALTTLAVAALVIVGMYLLSLLNYAPSIIPSQHGAEGKGIKREQKQ